MRALVAALMLCAGAAHAANPLPAEGAAKPTCQLGPLQYKNNTVKLRHCPAEAQDLIDRAFNCQHWTGEDPYNEARGHEIETAIAELKCDTLSLDYDRMLKKYAKQRDVAETLQAADREYSLEF